MFYPHKTHLVLIANGDRRRHTLEQLNCRHDRRTEVNEILRCLKPMMTYTMPLSNLTVRMDV